MLQCNFNCLNNLSHRFAKAFRYLSLRNHNFFWDTIHKVATFNLHGAAFSFGSRTPMRIEDPTPGPGAYGHFSRGVRSVPKRKLNLKGKAKGTRRRQREAAERQTQKKRVAHYV